jgi:hypothetical protein
MKYFVVQESSADALTDTVNEMLEDGWKLQGGMSVGGDNGYRFFCQAMIKETE